PAPGRGHTATLLPSGKVLFVGRVSSPFPKDPPLRAAIFDPGTSALEAGPPRADLADFERGHTATLLPSGDVLVVGGSPGTSGLSQVVHPDAGASSAEKLSCPRFGGHTATLLPSG